MGNAVLGQPSDAGTSVLASVCAAGAVPRRSGGGRGVGVGGGQLLPAQPIGIQERPPVSFILQEEIQPLTFGVAKLGVSFVDRKKAP